MSLRYLLDTNVVSSPISKLPNAEIVQRLAMVGHECAISAPVWHELTYGCHRLPSGKRRASLESYLQDVVITSFPVLAYDEQAAHRHGLERVRLEALGRSALYVDGQIAAIAFVNNLILVTDNVKDFSSFSDVTVENWSKRRGLR